MCPFKLNDEIVYIGNLELTYGLIPGNQYKVIEIRGKLYDNMGVINDGGFHLIPNWDNFISLKEARKKKLDKIS